MLIFLLTCNLISNNYRLLCNFKTHMLLTNNNF